MPITKILALFLGSQTWLGPLTLVTRVFNTHTQVFALLLHDPTYLPIILP
jgi:hypothetical protein